MRKTLGYVPARLPQHRPRNPIKPWFKVVGRPTITIKPKPVRPEWTTEPQYPPVDKYTLENLDKRANVKWYKSLNAIPTVDQRFLAFLKGRNGVEFHERVAIFKDKLPTYNSLPMVEYITNTRTINNLPQEYTSEDANVGIDSRKLNLLKTSVLNQIHLNNYASKQNPYLKLSVPKDDRPRPGSSLKSDEKIQQIMSSVKKVLPDSPLNKCQIDFNPSISSWWYHSKLEPAEEEESYKNVIDKDGNINQIIQTHCSTALNFRSNNLLQPFQDISEEVGSKYITDNRLPLKFYGAEFDIYKFPVMLPGYWNTELPEYDCPHLSVLTTDCLQARKSQLNVKELDDDENCLNAQALLTGFSWLNGLSAYHGFMPFEEITYPFTTQMITTNGQDWLFNVFQMNSHSYHNDVLLDISKAKINLFWTSGKMKLFDNYQDGSFSNVNEDVLKLLYKFSTNTSKLHVKEMRPFLGEDNREKWDRYEDMKELKRYYKNMSDTHKLKWNKVHLWEKIFFRDDMQKELRNVKPPYHVDYWAPKPGYKEKGYKGPGEEVC